MTALFQLGSFKLHSGASSPFKIDCDALQNEDWVTLAYLVHRACRPFTSVHGIPRGGLKLAKALEPYVDLSGPPGILIVDDVLTTGTSMEEARQVRSDAIVKGAVIFARSPHVADWITPIFRMIDRVS